MVGANIVCITHYMVGDPYAGASGAAASRGRPWRWRAGCGARSQAPQNTCPPVWPQLQIRRYTDSLHPRTRLETALSREMQSARGRAAGGPRSGGVRAVRLRPVCPPVGHCLGTGEMLAFVLFMKIRSDAYISFRQYTGRAYHDVQSI